MLALVVHYTHELFSFSKLYTTKIQARTLPPWVGFNFLTEVINSWRSLSMFCVLWNYNVKPLCGRDRCPRADIGLDKVPERLISRSSSKSILGGVGRAGLWLLFRWSGGRVCGLLLYSNILPSSEKLELILILLCRVGGGEVERSEPLAHELESSKLDASLVSLFFLLRPHSILFWTL